MWLLVDNMETFTTNEKIFLLIFGIFLISIILVATGANTTITTTIGSTIPSTITTTATTTTMTQAQLNSSTNTTINSLDMAYGENVVNVFTAPLNQTFTIDGSPRTTNEIQPYLPSIGILQNTTAINDTIASNVFNSLKGDFGNQPSSSVIEYNYTTNETYGYKVKNGTRLVANSHVNYAFYNNKHILTIDRVNIVKATPSLNCSLSGSANGRIAQPNQVSMIHLPVINGHLGLHGGTTYNLTGSCQASTIDNLTYTYTVSFSNGTTYTSNVLTANSVNIPFNIPNVPLSVQASIVFDVNGNGNYISVDPSANVIPAGIGNYISYTITANAAQIGNFPTTYTQLLKVNEGVLTNYLTCNAINGEWFYDNGSIIQTQLEGNALGFNQINSPCINTANQVIYAANLVGGLFKTVGSNTIYFGINAVNGNNDLMDCATTGMSPLLSVGFGGYGNCDNGANVWAKYQNFKCAAGGSCAAPSGWTTTGTGILIANGVTAVNNGAGGAWSTVTYQPTSTTNGFYMLGWYNNQGASSSSYSGLEGKQDSGYQGGSSGNNIAIKIDGAGFTSNLAFQNCINSGCTNGGNAVPTGVIALWGINWAPLVGVNAVNTTSNSLFQDTQTGSNIAGSTMAMFQGQWQVGGNPETENTYFFAVAQAPPVKNVMGWNVLPFVSSNGLVIQVGGGGGVSGNILIANPNPPQVTNITLDVGQKTVINTIISNGIAPYVGNWIWTPPNSLTGGSQSNTIKANILFGTLANSVLIGNFYSASNVIWSFNIPSSTTANTFYANIVSGSTVYGSWTVNGAYSDSAGNTLNRIGQTTLTINPLLQTVNVVSSNAVADQTQWETETFVWTGGSPKYVTNVLVANTAAAAGSQILGNAITSGVSGSSKTLTWQIGTGNNALGTGSISATVNDAATFNVANTVTNTLTINPQLLAPAPTATNNPMDVPQVTTLTQQSTGGTSSFTYQWYTIAGSTAPTCTAANQIAGATSTTYTASPISTNSYAYQVTDSASTPMVVCSSGLTVTVNPVLQFISLTSSNSVVDQNQWETHTLTWSGGSSTYTGNISAANTVASPSNILYNSITSGLGGTTFTLTSRIPISNNALGTGQLSGKVSDSATTQTSNSGTNTITINPQFLSTAWTASNNPVLATQYQVLTATVSGGTLGSGYTYNFVVYNAVGTLVTNILIVNSLTTNTFTFQELAAWGTGQFTANVAITDTASTTNTITNTMTYSVGVSPIFVQNWNSNFTFTASNTITIWHYPIRIGALAASGITFVVNTIPALVYNPVSFSNSSYSVVFGANTVLNGNILAYNITINPSVYVTTNGFSLIAYNAIINNGNILTGNSITGAGGANGAQGGNYPFSYGGSGGGGQGGGMGGNTLIAGGAATNPPANGANTPVTTITNANVLSWYTSANGIVQYLSGAGGGAGSGNGACKSGGDGAYGLYLQANYIKAGNIIANGISGNNCGGAGGLTGGGGGGGVILIATNSLNGGYSAGTYNVLGGLGNTVTGSGIGGVGNVVTYSWITPPVSNTLLIPFNSNLVAGSNSFTYIPPPSQLSGNYVYTVNEFASGALQATIVESLLPLDMNVLQSQLSVTNGINSLVQYFPIPINTPQWYSPPNSFVIDGYSNTLTPINGVVVTRGSSTLSLPLKLQLTYLFTTFNTVLTNNQIVSAFTLNAFQFIPSNVVPTQFPIYRPIFNFSSVDEQFPITNVVGLTSVSATYLFNNYTIANVSTYTWNSFRMYIPLSTFQNPSITITGSGFTSSGASHIPAVNNFCDAVIANATWKTYTAYLVNAANGSLYSFNIFSGGINNFIQILKGASNATATIVQQYKIAANPFSLPLQNAQTYSFRFLSPNCKLLFATNYSIWASPITLSVPTNNTVPAVTLPNVTASCTETYNSAIKNTVISCSGNDLQNVIVKWKVQIFNASSLVGYTLVNQTIFVGNSFVFTKNTGLSNTIVYQVKVLATQGSAIGDPIYTIFSKVFNPLNKLITSNFPAKGLIAFFWILIVIAIGKRSISAGLMVGGFMLFPMYGVFTLFGAQNFITLGAMTGLAVAMIAIGVLVHRYESNIAIG